MSQENVDAVRAVYEHFNETGEPKWDLFDRDAVLDASNIPGFCVVTKHDDLRALLHQYAAAFEDWRMEPDEIVDAGERVFAAVRDGGQVKGTEDEISIGSSTSGSSARARLSPGRRFKTATKRWKPPA